MDAQRGQAMSEELIGSVGHYFAKPQVGVVKLTGDLKIGDTLKAVIDRTKGEGDPAAIQIRPSARSGEIYVTFDVQAGFQLQRATRSSLAAPNGRRD